MRLAFLIFVTLTLLQANEAEAREYNRAMCILLKQQMAQFDHSRTHPSYRKAQRDYDSNCPQLDKAQAQQQVQRTRPQVSATALVKPEPFTEQVKGANSADQALVSTKVQNDQNNALAGEITSPQTETPLTESQQVASETATKSDIETQASDLTTPANTQQSASDAAATQVAPAKATPAKVNPKPQPTAQASTNTLLDMAIPAIIALLVLIVGLATLLVLRKKRQDTPKVAKPKLSSEGEVKAIKKPSGLKMAWKKLTGSKHATLDPQLYSKFTAVPIAVGEQGKIAHIEHLLLSQFGVFMVAHIDVAGDIYGGEKAHDWTARHNGEDEKFANPLTVLREQAHALAQVLALPMQEIHCLILFNQDAVFKSPMPSSVLYEKDFVDHVLSISTQNYGEELSSIHKDKIKQLLAHGAYAPLNAAAHKPEPSEEADTDAAAEPAQQPTPQAPDEGEPQAPNVAPLRREPTAAKATSQSEGQQHSAEIHPFVRKKADASDEQPASPEAAPAEPSSSAEPETETAPQESKSTSQLTAQDWSSMSDEEFMAYLDQVTGYASSKATPSKADDAQAAAEQTTAAPLPQESADEFKSKASDEPVADSQQPQAHPEPNMDSQVPAEDIEPATHFSSEEEPQEETQPLGSQLTPATHHEAELEAETKAELETQLETEVSLDLNNADTQSLDDALLELESALAQQTPEQEQEPAPETEVEEDEEQNKKAKANPFANLSLDPNFTPQEEKIDIGAGPLESEKS
ncbi:NERD domain-containing protein [Pseudoalteromonas sp. YIC-827]|uniref:NERD domain-containing protein n=1 Tax=Pseudoalteromonas qingdaonensis TaxID=3131913 RepID=A0ABU9MU77_9GAMM